VGGVIVHDDMDIELFMDLSVDLFEKLPDEAGVKSERNSDCSKCPSSSKSARLDELVPWNYARPLRSSPYRRDDAYNELLVREAAVCMLRCRERPPARPVHTAFRHQHGAVGQA
jgi:hypothetical protein